MPGPISCSRERARLIGGMIGELGLEVLLRLEEEDPQYKAVKGIVEGLGRGSGLVVVILTALVTYRLPMRGEDWWRCAEEYMKRQDPPATIAEAVDLVKGFIRACGRSLLSQRLGRLERIRSSSELVEVLEELRRKPLLYPGLAQRLWGLISKALSQPRNAKTIVFSLKMGYYAYRVAGGDPSRISGLAVPLPIDSRIACLTYSSRLCDVASGGYRVLITRPRPAQEVWRIVSQASGVSTIHLDALAWRLGWIPRDSKSVEGARRRAYELLARYANGRLAFKVCSELITRLCR